MELVRAATLTGYFPVAEQLRLDPVPLMRRLGLAPSMMADPEQMLPARSVFQLMEDSAAASGCMTFGLRMGEQRALADLGLVSLLVAHQPTLADALAVIGEYRHRLNSVLMLRIEQFGQYALIREQFVLDPPMLARQAEELALAVLDRTCRTVLGARWNPIRIGLQHDTPAGSERDFYRRTFACPVEFGSDFDGILIDRNDLTLPNPRADPALAQHARRLVEAIVDPGERTIVEEVEQAIMMLMPAGRVSLANIARSLGMNVRTLQRRLDQENAKFSDVLDRLRTREVNRLLAQRRLSMTDMAHLLGYSSLSAFSNWYRDRFSETPTDGRLRVQGQTGS